MLIGGTGHGQQMDPVHQKVAASLEDKHAENKEVGLDPPGKEGRSWGFLSWGVVWRPAISYQAIAIVQV